MPRESSLKEVCIVTKEIMMKYARIYISILVATISLLVLSCSRKKVVNQENNPTGIQNKVEEERFPILPELTEPISTNLAYRSNPQITGLIQGWEERSRNLDAEMIMNGDTTILPKCRVMLVDGDYSHYTISESPVSGYNKDGNILNVYGRSSKCPYSYDMFSQDSLIVDESGIPGDFDFKLRNITQEQWRSILTNIAPVRIRKDHPITPVLYYDKGDDYKYAILFSVRMCKKGIVACGFDYNSLPDTEEGKYFKKALLAYTYLWSHFSETPKKSQNNRNEWLEIFDFEH